MPPVGAALPVNEKLVSLSSAPVVELTAAKEVRDTLFTSVKLPPTYTLPWATSRVTGVEPIEAMNREFTEPFELSFAMRRCASPSTFENCPVM